MLKMIRNNTINSGLVVAGIGLLLGAACVPAHAQLTTFAEFGKNGSTPANPFVFTNSGTSGNFGTATTSEAFKFQYDTTNGYDGSGYNNISSLLTVTASASGAAVLSGSTLTQNLSSITFSFQATTPNALGFRNLLSGTFTASSTTNIFLTGTAGGGGLTLNVSSTSPSGVTGFTSDFLDFSNAQTYTTQQFAISLSGVINTSGSNSGNAGPNQTSTSSYLDSLQASGTTGTFSSNPVPPSFTPTPATPGDISLATGLLVGAFHFGRVKLRTRKKNTATA